MERTARFGSLLKLLDDKNKDVQKIIIDAEVIIVFLICSDIN